MSPSPLSPSGVLGLPGRVIGQESADVRSADLAAGRRAAADARPRPHVRLRHHALRRHPPRPRGDLRVGRRRWRRCSRQAGVDVVRSRNVTDVDDVLTRAADAAGPALRRVRAHPGVRRSSRTCARSACARRRIEPRARHHIAHVAAAGRGAAAAGRAPTSATGTVFFRGGDARRPAGLDREAGAGSWPRSSATSPTTRCGRTRSTSRCGGPPARRDPAWPSPWGWGRPGWHAECAAMAHATLGLRRGRAGRRRGPGLPAPRLPGGDGRGRHRRGAVRAGAAACRGGVTRTARRWRSRPATWCSSRTC